MIALMPQTQSTSDRVLQLLRNAAKPGTAGGVVAALLLVATITATLEFVKNYLDLPPVVITYLIPVLIVAIRWGFLPALVATVAGAACAAFFFYKPTHTFLVEDPARRLGLLIFTVVALVSAHLAVRV